VIDDKGSAGSGEQLTEAHGGHRIVAVLQAARTLVEDIVLNLSAGR